VKDFFELGKFNYHRAKQFPACLSTVT